MEAEVLKKDDLATGSGVDGLLDLGADAVLGESDGFAEQLGEDGDNRLKAILLVDLAVRAAEVGHQDDGLGAVVDGILDGGQGTDDALVVGDGLVLVERDIEVDLRSDYEPLDHG
jgi:hypothetical protein